MFGQGIVFRLVQKEGAWGRGYGMGVMWVTYEDDIPKIQGLKVPRHGALGSGLGVGKTFVSYCISISLPCGDCP